MSMIESFTFPELKEKIEQWIKDRNLDTTSPDKQTLKLMEEVGELAEALLENNREAIVDALGDILVVMLNLHSLLNTTFEEALNHAWKEIENRKGVTVNGVFIRND